MTMNKALVAQIRDALNAAIKSPATGVAVAADADNALRCLATLEEDEQCSGWSNWESWNVALHLGNDSGTYDASRQIVRDNALEDGTAAAALKEFCEEICLGDEPPASMGTDLLNGALGAVNWQEIAANIASELEAE